MKHAFLAALVAVSLSADQGSADRVPATRTLRGGVAKPAARPSGPIDVAGSRRHVDVGGDLTGSRDARHRHAGQHLDPAGGGRHDDAHHRRLQRRAAADVVARRTDDRLLRVSRRRLRPLGGQPGRIQPAQADLGHVRRSRADLFARRHARSPSRPIAATRSAATTTSSSSTRARARSRRSPRAPARTSCRPGRPTTARSPSPRRATTTSGLWAVNVATGAERKLRTVSGGKVDAPSWGPGGQLLYHVTAGGQTRFEIDGKPVTGSENVFAFRASWASRVGIRLRVRRQDPQALGLGVADADGRVHGDPAGDPPAVHQARARLHVDGAAPGAGHRAPVDLSRRHADRLCRRRRHLRHAGRRGSGQPHEGRRARHRSGVVARRRRRSSTRPTKTASSCSCGSAT